MYAMMYIAQRSPATLSGRPRKNTIIMSKDSASITLPMTMNGRNLPNLLRVLSIMPPSTGSVTPSNTRMSGTNAAVNALTPSMSAAFTTTPARAAPELPVRYIIAKYVK